MSKNEEQTVVVGEDELITLTKSTSHRLNVPVAAPRRPSSPDVLSLLSIEDFSELRLSRTSSSQQDCRRHNELDGKLSTWRDTLRASWVRNKGVLLVITSQFFGTMMAVSTRLLVTDGPHGKALDPLQILFARFIITTTLATLYMWRNKTPDFPLGPPGVRVLLVLRGIGGFFGVFGLYWALQYLPLADAIVITFIAPFVACIICARLMNEPFTRAEQICGLLAFGGVILIARPTSFFSSMASSTTGKETVSNSNSTLTNSTLPAANIPTAEGPHMRLAAVGMSLLGVCGAACAYTTIRQIGKRAHPLISVNYLAVWCLLVSTVSVFSVPSVGFVLPRNVMEWGLLLWMGISGFVMQFLLTAGLAYSTDARATHMVYTQMVFALAFDRIIWKVTPGVLEVMGSGLILGSAIFVAVKKGGGETRGEDRERVTEDMSLRRIDEEVGLVEGMETGREEEEETENRQ